VERQRQTQRPPGDQPATPHDLKPYNKGSVEHRVTITNNVVIGQGTVIHNRITIRGLAIVGENCEIGPTTYIGPYTIIVNNCTIQST